LRLDKAARTLAHNLMTDSPQGAGPRPLGGLCADCPRAGAPPCPGRQPEERRPPEALPVRSLLDGRFLLGRVLGAPGGFGITYLACDTVLQAAVAIKEYLPAGLAAREAGGVGIAPKSQDLREDFARGKERFLGEARALARFSHPNVVRIRDFFEQHGTAYLVMDYHEGVTLDELARQRGGKIPEAQALALILPVLDGLRAVHAQGFLHRDIKPSNIYLAQSGQALLLDFGAARPAWQATDATSLSRVYTPNFAPLEQYSPNGGLGPWTDIYACGATLYCLVTGAKPTPALNRHLGEPLTPPERLEPGVTPRFSRAVMRALAMAPEARPQRVEEWQALLAGDGLRAAAPAAGLPDARRYEVHCPRCGLLNENVAALDLHRGQCRHCGGRLALEAGLPKAALAAAGILALAAAVAAYGLLGGGGGQYTAPAVQARTAPGSPGGAALPAPELPAAATLPIPPRAILACKDKAGGGPCEVMGLFRPLPGICRATRQGYLACAPDALIPRGGGRAKQ